MKPRTKKTVPRKKSVVKQRPTLTLAPSTKEVTQEINRLHEEIEGLWEGIQTAQKEAFQKALRVGQLLTEQKKRMKRGEWTPWLQGGTLRFSHQTAYNYMELYKRRQELKIQNVLKLSDAYRYIRGEELERPRLPVKRGLPKGINRIAEVLSKTKTPERHIKELRKLELRAAAFDMIAQDIGLPKGGKAYLQDVEKGTIRPSDGCSERFPGLTKGEEERALLIMNTRVRHVAEILDSAKEHLDEAVKEFHEFIEAVKRSDYQESLIRNAKEVSDMLGRLLEAVRDGEEGIVKK
jgi:hypothetical protein